MNLRKLIEKRLREGGSNVTSDVNAAVATNVGEGRRSHMSVKSRRRVVQRNGRTLVDERSDETERGTA